MSRFAVPQGHRVKVAPVGPMEVPGTPRDVSAQACPRPTAPRCPCPQEPTPPPSFSPRAACGYPLPGNASGICSYFLQNLWPNSPETDCHRQYITLTQAVSVSPPLSDSLSLIRIYIHMYTNPYVFMCKMCLFVNTHAFNPVFSKRQGCCLRNGRY